MLNIIKQNIIKRSFGSIISSAMYKQSSHRMKVLHLMGKPWQWWNSLLLGIYKLSVQRIAYFKEFKGVASSSIPVLSTKYEDIYWFLHEAFVVGFFVGSLFPKGFFC